MADDPQVQPLAAPTTGSKGQTIHSKATQTAQGGYAKGQLVQADGVIWRSQLANNMSHPGDHGWMLFW